MLYKKEIIENNKELKKRIEKAIEFINTFEEIRGHGKYNFSIKEDLLNILKGVDKEWQKRSFIQEH